VNNDETRRTDAFEEDSTNIPVENNRSMHSTSADDSIDNAADNAAVEHTSEYDRPEQMARSAPENTPPPTSQPAPPPVDPYTPPPVNPIGEPTPMQRTGNAARTQAGAAAQAFRRGEFMHEATVDGAASNDDRLIALLSYVTQVFIPVIMPIIVLLSDSSKNRPFQRYHAVQSLALTLLFLLIGVAASLGALIIQIIPVIGQLVALLLFCLSPIAYIMAVIAMFYYGYQGYQGKRFAIPGLTAFLRDQGWLS
jgi:uncharacterized membrane protein